MGNIGNHQSPASSARNQLSQAIPQFHVPRGTNAARLLASDTLWHFMTGTPFLPTKNLCGPHPQYGWDFPEEIPEKFRNFFPETLSERFLGLSLESTAGMPQTL